MKSVVITVHVIAMWEVGNSTGDTLSLLSIYKKTSFNWISVLFCLRSVCVLAQVF